MIKKKVCLLGDFAVGKTSLVSRFVHSAFSDRYLTTIGVKIDKKSISIGEKCAELVFWDMNGHDRYQQVMVSYTRGAAGIVIVVDGTRPESLSTALELKDRAVGVSVQLPHIIFANKRDLEKQFEMKDRQIEECFPDAINIVSTSAKTGEMVEEGFTMLAEETLRHSGNA
jgi:small GTP-binding protein